ncbi:hypothetical protein EGR_06423 [Echinococcus granulosus]|uniref:Uncharacterized protein n=1 Tax=Echinococcus granulosus TaxID=6210 RepID=W6UKX9_ECHGR|nr:hypothetical protein EGR_06423 [Echinococcus granulosus]EUB58752.1 hypothetical protein EGR_06423 [Echinococcus granulosus]
MALSNPLQSHADCKEGEEAGWRMCQQLTADPSLNSRLQSRGGDYRLELSILRLREPPLTVGVDRWVDIWKVQNISSLDLLLTKDDGPEYRPFNGLVGKW